MKPKTIKLTRKPGRRLATELGQRAELAEFRLKIAMDALDDISTIPRVGRAGRLAAAVAGFLRHVNPNKNRAKINRKIFRNCVDKTTELNDTIRSSKRTADRAELG